ncbi:hypothetical protein H2248_002720 [Termitomyces sp. 'cryptogamus']|nr:hypothetical protein H2248_002720 [Termitomyces sp. 'cryptogamus']
MNIAACRECMKDMGKYPVLLLDLEAFESDKGPDFKNELYHRFFQAVLRSAEMCGADVIPQIEELWEKRSNSNLKDSILEMIGRVRKSTKEAFIVLIDEYDHP